MVKSRESARLDRQIAFLIGAITIGLLLRNVARDLLPGDPGEFQFAAWRLGLAHPTGYPLYLLIGGLWQRLWSFVGVSPAFSLNALSAVFTGIAAALFYRLMVRWLPGRGVAVRLAAGLAVAFLVANPTVRSQSLAAEVYSLHLLFMIAILMIAQMLVAQHTGPALAKRKDSPTPLIALAFLLGLSLTHHATTVLLIPSLLLYLWSADRSWWRPGRAWLWAVPAFIAPLLLYVYIPLRSGVAASPWYHQKLGDGVIDLYDGTWQAFLDYISGQSISVGFHSLNLALGAAPVAVVFWLRHFEWPGLVLMGAGLVVLVRVRAWPVLLLTASYLVLHQVFNLFYAIGDIFVYYIPLYLMACIWIGYGAAGIGAAFRFAPVEAAEAGVSAPRQAVQTWTTAFLVILYLAPLQLWARYTTLMEQIQQDSAGARAMWENILAAEPPTNAVLVSNDRNEIVPLFYLQAVDGRATEYTGLFPLMAPDARFADIGATIQTALEASNGQPVYLIKKMPGLETRFALAERNAPLVEVTGPAASTPPATAVNQRYGPLELLGYDVQTVGENLEIDLHWKVKERLPDNYTTTVQLFDASGAKIGQGDRPPGSDYYPTSRWKIGETLIDSHSIAVPAGATPQRMRVGMYSGPDATLIAPALEVPWAFGH